MTIPPMRARNSLFALAAYIARLPESEAVPAGWSMHSVWVHGGKSHQPTHTYDSPSWVCGALHPFPLELEEEVEWL